MRYLSEWIPGTEMPADAWSRELALHDTADWEVSPSTFTAFTQTEAQVLPNAGPVRLEAEHEVQALLQLQERPSHSGSRRPVGGQVLATHCRVCCASAAPDSARTSEDSGRQSQSPRISPALAPDAMVEPHAGTSSDTTSDDPPSRQAAPCDDQAQRSRSLHLDGQDGNCSHPPRLDPALPWHEFIVHHLKAQHVSDSVAKRTAVQGIQPRTSAAKSTAWAGFMQWVQEEKLSLPISMNSSHMVLTV